MPNSRDALITGIGLFAILLDLLVYQGNAGPVSVIGIRVCCNDTRNALDTVELLDQVAAKRLDFGVVQGTNQGHGLVHAGVHGTELLLHIGNRLEVLHAGRRTDVLSIRFPAHQGHVDLAG